LRGSYKWIDDAQSRLKIDPVLDNPEKDAEYIAQYPEYGYSNVWPEDLPEFKVAFKDVCLQLHHVFPSF
jgi:hypothetical protein